MILKKYVFLFVTCVLLFLGCDKEKEPDPFEISKNRIGFLTADMSVNQLDSIYMNDSVIRKNSATTYLGKPEIEIFEKGGKKLLILEPGEDNKINTVQILDARYHTVSGFSKNDSFKTLKEQHTISKISNTLNAAVIFIDSLNASVTIDKDQLPDRFRINTDEEIKASDIPDSAKINYFLLNWK